MMTKKERERLQQMLTEMTIVELASHLADPCDDCDTEICPGRGVNCGYYESREGIRFGPVQAKAELIRRQNLITAILKGI